MTSRNDESMVETFKSVYEFLKKHNCSPKLHVLDNKCSKAVQDFVEKEATSNSKFKQCVISLSERA